MPSVSCPIAGFENVTVTYPDEWLMEHRDKFYVGWSSAPINASPKTKELYGIVALCDTITGIDLKGLGKLPLHYTQALNWLIDTVNASYEAAQEIPKNS